MKRAIVIMTKVPTAGKVKTRLQSTLSPEQSAELAKAFLQDTESKAKAVCENTILAFSPAGKLRKLQNLLQHKHIFIEQRGADLGERMSNAFEFAFAQGLDVVVIIGTDSPTFPANFIERAFEFLEANSDMVLGKTKDGGFYSIGLRKFVPNLFDGVAWSTDSVYEQTLINAKQLGLDKLPTLPEWYDVDTPDDLIFLRNKMLADKEIQKNAPATCRWLLSHSELFDKD